MTESSESGRNDYIGTGLVDEYDYTFRLLSDEDLRVIVSDTDGVETVLVLDTDYTVDGVGDANGGTITLLDGALADDYLISLRRYPTLVQNTDLRNQTAPRNEDIEDAFDRQTHIAQRLADELARALRLPETEAGTLAKTLLPRDRASKWLAFNADSEPIAAEGSSGEVPVTAWAATLLDDTTVRQARGTLGVGQAVDVTVYGAVGDGTTDDTAAIDAALAISSTIYLPAGTYVYTGVATGKFCHGPGKIVTTSGGSTPYRNIRYRIGTSAFLTSEPSWIGLVNVDFGADNATRFYLVPKAAVTTGVGGALKIFGDPYHDGASYRDLGIYFSADQGGENGYNNQGVFWINSKVNGAPYTNANPDIGFSFQDGSVVAGRFTFINNGFGTYSVFVMGSGEPAIAPLVGTVRAEINGDFGFRNDKYLRWSRANGTSIDCTIGLNSSDELEVKVAGGTVFKCLGTPRFDLSAPIVRSHKAVTDNSATLSMSNHDSATLGNTLATTITAITGSAVAGREINLIFGNSNTTIEHNASIVLQTGVNFAGTANDVLTLVHTGSKWVEKSRSVNP